MQLRYVFPPLTTLVKFDSYQKKVAAVSGPAAAPAPEYHDIIEWCGENQVDSGRTPLFKAPIRLSTRACLFHCAGCILIVRIDLVSIPATGKAVRQRRQ